MDLNEAVQQALRAKLLRLCDKAEAKKAELGALSLASMADAGESIALARETVDMKSLSDAQLVEQCALVGRLYHLLDAWCVVQNTIKEQGNVRDRS